MLCVHFEAWVLVPLKGAAARCVWPCACVGGAAGCCSRVLLRDVYGHVRFGAWMLVLLRVAPREF